MTFTNFYTYHNQFIQLLYFILQLSSSPLPIHHNKPVNINHACIVMPRICNLPIIMLLAPVYATYLLFLLQPSPPPTRAHSTPAQAVVTYSVQETTTTTTVDSEKALLV